MPGEIGQAFVRIRPNTTGFKQEAEGGIKSALVGAAKIAGGIFAAREIGQGVSTVVKAAAQQQEELAVVRNAVKANQAAWVVHGKTVEETLRHEAVTFGFTVADLAQGFTRLEVGTKDSAKSLHLLGLAEDVARARHLGLAQASVILAKASQGNDTSIRRLGIIIPKLTTHVTELRNEHDKATASGIKFSASQNLVYKSALVQAKALDDASNKTRIIGEIQSRFGGQSEAFAKTAQGAFQNFHEALNEFEVSLGKAFIPTLTEGATAASHLFTSLADGEGVAHVAAETSHEIAHGFRIVGDVFEAIAPGIHTVGHALAELTRFAGVGGILAAVAGFKALGVAQGLATAIQARYTAVVAAGRGETVAQATSEEALTAANAEQIASLNALTGALVANTDALGVRAAALETNAVATSTLARANVTGALAADANAAANTAGAFTRLSTGIGAVGRGLFSLAGGWTTVAAIGLGALAFGIYKVITATSAEEQANDRLLDSLRRLDAGYTRAADLSRRYAQTVSSIQSDKVAIAAGKTNVALAEQAVATSTLSHSSLGYQQLVRQLEQAQDSLRVATKQLSDDEAQAAKQRVARDKQQAANAVTHAAAIKSAIDLERQAARDAAAQTEGPITGVTQAEAQHIRAARAIEAAAKAGNEFADALDRDATKLAQGNAPLLAELQLLAQFSREVGKPSIKTIRVVLEAKTAAAGLAALIVETERLNPTVGGFVKTLHQESEALSKSNPVLARRLILLADFAKLSGRQPTAQEAEATFKAPNFQSAVQALAATLEGMKARSGKEGFASGKAFADFFVEGELSRSGPLFGPVLNELRKAKAEAKDALSIKDVGKDEISAAVATAQAAKTTVATAAAAVRDAATTVKSAVRDLSDANIALADAIRSGNQSVKDAIIAADQNLFQIGASLSDSINEFLDAQKKAKAAAGLDGPTAAEFRRLKEQIKKGGDDEETLRRGHALATQIQQQAATHPDAADDSKKQDARRTRVKREIADLVDEFNKGELTVAQFQRRLQRILEREGINYKNAGKRLGIAFADGFEAEVQGIIAQARAIAAGPRGRRGQTGLEPTIVRPLEALRESQRSIASAQRNRDDAAQAVRVAQKDLSSKTEQHTRAIENLTRAEHHLDSLQEQHLAYLKEKARVEAEKEAARHRALMVQERAQTKHLRGIDEKLGQGNLSGPRSRRDSGKRGTGDAFAASLGFTKRGVTP